MPLRFSICVTKTLLIDFCRKSHLEVLHIFCSSMMTHYWYHWTRSTLRQGVFFKHTRWLQSFVVIKKAGVAFGLQCVTRLGFNAEMSEYVLLHHRLELVIDTLLSIWMFYLHPSWPSFALSWLSWRKLIKINIS